MINTQWFICLCVLSSFIFPRLTQIPPQNCATVRPLLAIGQRGGCCENICHSSFNEAPCWPSCAKWRRVFLGVISTWTLCNADVSPEWGEVQFPRICIWTRLSVNVANAVPLITGDPLLHNSAGSLDARYSYDIVWGDPRGGVIHTLWIGTLTAPWLIGTPGDRTNNSFIH